MHNRNYYDILGITTNATDEEIRLAYRKLVLKWHPDRNPSAEAQEKIKYINEAYETLSDPVKHKRYDAALRLKRVPTQSYNWTDDDGPVDSTINCEQLLADLDYEIERLAKTKVEPERIKQRDHFARDFRHVYNELKEDIKEQVDQADDLQVSKSWQHKNIMQSPAAKLAQKTTQTLRQLTYRPEKQQEDKNVMLAYAKHCETSDIPYKTNFCKAIATVLITGLGFILGAAVGAVVGLLAAFWYAYVPYSIFIAPPLGTIMGGIIGTLLARDLADNCLPLPNGSIQDALMFNTPFYSNANKASQSGIRFFDQGTLLAEQAAQKKRQPREPVCKAELYAMAKP